MFHTKFWELKTKFHNGRKMSSNKVKSSKKLELNDSKRLRQRKKTDTTSCHCENHQVTIDDGIKIKGTRSASDIPARVSIPYLG